MKKIHSFTLLACFLPTLLISACSFLPAPDTKYAAKYWLDQQGNCKSATGGIGIIDLRDNLKQVGAGGYKWDDSSCKSLWKLPGMAIDERICIDLQECDTLYVKVRNEGLEFFTKQGCKTRCD